ncbi:ABC transporter permease [Paenibacillus sp. LHD-117]|uniref:ABC transporter permease n=1 Tax=Paenibacillus sp. LHD-117 TaxID=3071412 RepID=UPI0027E0485B|nr:ABC transporter permease [Paenibacillus sp. LHD-117]MDQ6422250.1 ABC transporter permease [Paenibacillus sp. LHD-117]
MNVLRIMLKELKVIRDPKMIVFLLVSPLLIMLIMGTALTNAFNGSLEVGEINVLYKNNHSSSEFSAYWDDFTGQMRQAGIQLVEADEKMDGKLEVKNNLYEGYVEISDSGLKYYNSSQSLIESDIAQSLLTAFADRYRLAAEVAGTDPEQANAIMAGSGGESFVAEESLIAARKPGAMDYFAIAVTTMIILYSALSAAQLIDSERKRNTAVRLLASPVTKIEIFAGKLAGIVVLNFIITIIVVLISKYMFNAYWGENLGLVFLTLLTEIIFAVSLGLGFSYVLKGNASGTVVMIIIQLAAFLGGSYFPVENATGIMATLASFSPLQWSNAALLEMIYADNLSAMANAMLLNIGFAVVLLGIGLTMMRRKEGL